MNQRNRDARAPEGVREDAIAWLVRLRSSPSEEHRAAFEAWYAANPRHADSYDALLDSWEATQLASITPAGRQARPRSSRSWRQVAAAAAVLLVVAASVFLANDLWPGAAPEARLATGVGEIRTITLDDGSRVTLDTDSLLRVALDDRARRLLLERGRARFEVARDDRRPFVVAAGATEVVAHGTVFDVDRASHRIVVALLEGAVEVRRSGPMVGQGTMMLAPGQQIAIDDSAALTRPTTIRPSEVRWPAGMLSFEDVPLAEVLASANRYSPTQIVIGDPAAAQHRFTGTFKPGEPSRLAETIGSMFRLRVERDRSGTLVLTSQE